MAAKAARYSQGTRVLPFTDCKEDGCYYSVVDEKVFMEKMKEWHIELEDNKPEEIPPWKEQI